MVEHKKKLRVFILSNDDLTSNLIFSPLFQSPFLQIVGLAFTSTLTKKKGRINGAVDLLRRMSFCYWLYLVITSLIFKLYEIMAMMRQPKRQDESCVSLRVRASMQNIAVLSCADFNQPEFTTIVRQSQPDIIIIRIDQILKTGILTVPPHGIWCVHSSLLPSYRGIAAEFHSLRNGETRVGSTIFKVTPELDKGPSLRQVSIPIRDDSVFSLTLKNNLAAANMLHQTLTELATSGTVAIQLDPVVTSKSYFSWPSPFQAKQLQAKGGTIFRMRDLRELVRVLKWKP